MLTRKIVAATVPFVSSLIGLSAATPALARSVYVKTKDANGFVNVRSQPSTQGRFLYCANNRVVLKGIRTAKDGDGFTWVKVKPNRRQTAGWIRADFLSLQQPRGGGKSWTGRCKEPVVSSRSNNCDAAYQNMVARLNRVPSVRVTTKKTWKITEYTNFPYPGTHALSIGMLGAGVSQRVFKSPKFLTSVATDFLNNCKTVTLLKLGQANSHLIATFGVVNGRVKAFKCYDVPAGMRSYEVKSVPWGRTLCL